MSKSVIAVIASLVATAAILFLLARNETAQKRTLQQGESSKAATTDNSSESEVHLSCAASNQAVIEEIRKQYEAETGRKVVVQYGSSQSILTQLTITQSGDLFLPADDSYIKIAENKNLASEVVPIATMRCGIVVKKGNPLGITNLNSIIEKQAKLVQASPESAAVGKVTKQALMNTGDWEAIDRATAAYRGTVTEVANDIRIDAADVGIVYDVVLHPYADLEFIEVPELESARSQVSICVLNSTKNSARALHFARYITAKNRGQVKYREYGFGVESGDDWQDVPELSIFAGSMLRPAIEQTISDFEKREGVQVTRVYNGCGILVAQMKSGQHPDAYFACDLEFMSQVKDLFADATSVSQNHLVILVPKGNPKKIASLQDLTKPGLRVGIGHEKQCAMGWITQNTFRESGIQKELMENVKVQVPTGDMLVNQLRTEALDAAVAYLSNAAGAADFLDAVEIVGIPCSIAIQPWAISKETHHSQLAGRLFAKIQSAESREVFESEGFLWKLNSPSSP